MSHVCVREGEYSRPIQVTPLGEGMRGEARRCGGAQKLSDWDESMARAANRGQRRGFPSHLVHCIQPASELRCRKSVSTQAPHGKRKKGISIDRNTVSHDVAHKHRFPLRYATCRQTKSPTNRSDSSCRIR